MLIGEKPPPWAPWTTIIPIIRGLMLYLAAKPSAIGAMIATAAGLTAPTEVSSAVMANITHGMAAMRPPTPRTASRTSQSMVPLFWAWANRKVIPTRVRNSSAGKPAMMALACMPATTEPTRKAPTKAMTPMLMGSAVARTNIKASTQIAIM